MVSLQNAIDVLLRISESGPNTCFELKSQKTKIDHDRLTFFAINFKVPTHIEWDGEKQNPRSIGSSYRVCWVTLGT